MAGLARWVAAKFARLPLLRTLRPRWTDACVSVRARHDGSGSPIVCGARARRGIGPSSPDSIIGFARGSVGWMGPPSEPDPVAGSNRGHATILICCLLGEASRHAHCVSFSHGCSAAAVGGLVVSMQLSAQRLPQHRPVEELQHLGRTLAFRSAISLTGARPENGTARFRRCNHAGAWPAARSAASSPAGSAQGGAWRVGQSGTAGAYPTARSCRGSLSGPARRRRVFAAGIHRIGQGQPAARSLKAARRSWRGGLIVHRVISRLHRIHRGA